MDTTGFVFVFFNFFMVLTLIGTVFNPGGFMCSETTIIYLREQSEVCSPDSKLVAVLLCPYYLPSRIIVVVIYVPPSADAEAVSETVRVSAGFSELNLGFFTTFSVPLEMDFMCVYIDIEL